MGQGEQEGREDDGGPRRPDGPPDHLDQPPPEHVLLGRRLERHQRPEHGQADEKGGPAGPAVPGRFGGLLPQVHAIMMPNWTMISGKATAEHSPSHFHRSRPTTEETVPAKPLAQVTGAPQDDRYPDRDADELEGHVGDRVLEEHLAVRRRGPRVQHLREDGPDPGDDHDAHDDQEQDERQLPEPPEPAALPVAPLLVVTGPGLGPHGTGRREVTVRRRHGPVRGHRPALLLPTGAGPLLPGGSGGLLPGGSGGSGRGRRRVPGRRGYVRFHTRILLAPGTRGQRGSTTPALEAVRRATHTAPLPVDTSGPPPSLPPEQVVRHPARAGHGLQVEPVEQLVGRLPEP